MLYHITTRDDWAEAEIQNTYKPGSLAAEGFIHLSTDKQLLKSANKFFQGKTSLLVIAISEKRLNAELRYETVDDDSYPHLFGPLNLEAVVEVVGLPLDTDGKFGVPAEWATWRSNFEK